MVEQVQTKKKKKKRKSSNVPFEEAKKIVQSEGIQSRGQYMEWHKLNNPRKLPRFPNRAYASDWVSWNDFLATNNKFNERKRSHRPLAEVMAWVEKQKLNDIKTKDDWIEYVIANRDKVPEDIPIRPDVVYKKDWRSWPHFLGTKIKEKIEAQKKVIEESALFYVIQEREYMDKRTVFTFGVEKGGKWALKEKWDVSKFRVVQMYRYDPNQIENVWKIIKQFSSSHFGAEHVRVVPNIHQLVWNISDFLDIVR